MKQYSPSTIESKWQKKWEKEQIYRAEFPSKQKKYYALIEFPYPSGERLHVGHFRPYVGFDVIARKRRMQGYNVLYPFGWDAFGLPAENYAIKTGIHPSVTTQENIANAKKQVQEVGLSFDWSREINTTDPNYYKWTQWIFLQLYKHGLAYRDEIAVNWCPSCRINLANEEVINGECERCGHETTRRMQKQWILRITEYADRLLEDLEEVDYREDIARQQREWIGRKEGINITYPIDGLDESITTFTTRPDTNFGATFIVLSPEHPLAEKIATEEYQRIVEEYIHQAGEKSELERMQEAKEKTGVFTGRYAINRLNDEKLPIWVGDFVLGHVGTGAVVGVPGHDKRDFEFARKFGLPIRQVIIPSGGKEVEVKKREQVYEGLEGEVVRSGFLNGLSPRKAIQEVIDFLEEKGWGERTVSYHLRDWVFSRQHYWGEPIPIVYCEGCGEVPVPEDDLPVELPHVEKYEPTNTGESPLANVKDWVKTTCPKCGGPARRETDTMPNWAGSSWYFLRYCDPKNDETLASREALDYFMPVDWYNGGMEHTTLHLLYSRFWHKFLFDIGVVSTKEPYKRRTSHGVILAPGGKKMSKSKGNVINPDDIVEEYGADSLRVYEMFMGPFEEQIAWNDEALGGVRRFLERVWGLCNESVGGGLPGPLPSDGETPPPLRGELHRLVKKVSEDIEELKFNTAVAAMMEFTNQLRANQAGVGESGLDKNDWAKFLKLLAPFAPHIAEELWQTYFASASSGFLSIHRESWPQYDEELIKQEVVTIAVQVDGKVRGTIEIQSTKSEIRNEVEELAKKQDNVQKHLAGQKIRDVIFVPGKIINFVTS